MIQCNIWIYDEFTIPLPLCFTVTFYIMLHQRETDHICWDKYIISNREVIMKYSIKIIVLIESINWTRIEVHFIYPINTNQLNFHYMCFVFLVVELKLPKCIILCIQWYHLVLTFQFIKPNLIIFPGYYVYCLLYGFINESCTQIRNYI